MSHVCLTPLEGLPKPTEAVRVSVRTDRGRGGRTHRLTQTWRAGRPGTPGSVVVGDTVSRHCEVPNQTKPSLPLIHVHSYIPGKSRLCVKTVQESLSPNAQFHEGLDGCERGRTCPPAWRSLDVMCGGRGSRRPWPPLPESQLCSPTSEPMRCRALPRGSVWPGPPPRSVGVARGAPSRRQLCQSRRNGGACSLALL